MAVTHSRRRRHFSVRVSAVLLSLALYCSLKPLSSEFLVPNRIPGSSSSPNRFVYAGHPRAGHSVSSPWPRQLPVDSGAVRWKLWNCMVQGTLTVVKVNMFLLSDPSIHLEMAFPGQVCKVSFLYYTLLLSQTL